jgi:hypothetical protein
LGFFVCNPDPEFAEGEGTLSQRGTPKPNKLPDANSSSFARSRAAIQDKEEGDRFSAIALC